MMVFAKGVYPYSYVTSPEKFDDTQLPPIEAFYNTLTDEPLDVKDYKRSQKTWTRFGMQTLRDYHDHYLKSDVLLLADVTENFRNTIMKEHNLDFLHFVSLPGLSRQASAIKYTGPEPVLGVKSLTVRNELQHWACREQWKQWRLSLIHI